jgi:Cu(I)/Ag(I) efflux system protein CusF
MENSMSLSRSIRRPALGLLLSLPLLALALAAHAADGEVRKIDRAQSKITIRHGEIKNLDMPPMTMVFRARPASLLDGLAEGDRISFEADKLDGQYTVTAIQKRP